ncbi:MAG: hypothetical protein H6729_14245 [Deltaproteobacteria bacterium]|nr:hypothetical protein [Deltaproteobacteria bacterium]
MRAAAKIRNELASHGKTRLEWHQLRWLRKVIDDDALFLRVIGRQCKIWLEGRCPEEARCYAEAQAQFRQMSEEQRRRTWDHPELHPVLAEILKYRLTNLAVEFSNKTDHVVWTSHENVVADAFAD